MGNIDNMRAAYSIVKLGMDISDFILIAGVPDEKNDNGVDGYYIWNSSVWKGVFRGGYVNRKVVIYTKNRKIISWNLENLERSSW